MNALFLPSPTRTGHVDIASFAPMNLHKYGPRRETAQERGSSSIHHQLYEKKLVATPVPAYLIESPSEIHQSDTKAAFVPRGELAHEYWRAMIGASHVIERYRLYLGSHPSGLVADTVADRISELEQAAEKASSTKVRKHIVKAGKSQSTSKPTKPNTVQATLTLPIEESNVVKCGNQNDSKCRKPLQIPAKDCNSSSGLNPEGVCVRKNYRTSTIFKR